MWQKTFHQETRQGNVSTLSLFLTNKQQGDRDHSGVNQSETIIKSPMLIQLKVTQNEKKNKLKLNSLTSSIHPIKKKEKKKKHNQTFLTQTNHVLIHDYMFLVERTSRFVRCITLNRKFGLKLL